MGINKGGKRPGQHVGILPIKCTQNNSTSICILRKLGLAAQVIIITFITSSLLYDLALLIPTSNNLKIRTPLSTISPRNAKKNFQLLSPSVFSPLRVFQVYQPVVISSSLSDEVHYLGSSQGQDANEETKISSNCQVLLMDHSFNNSYGKPYIADYIPPPCEFNRVIMNFTTISLGRQFDRLAIMYLGDIEVWRTSTAEPKDSGIVFEYIKDMSTYISLWRSPQKLIFDLGNLIDDTYNGAFNTTLTAVFSTESSITEHASQILPISNRKSNTNASSVFKLPPDRAINNITLPQNINRAIFSISACGQGNEEFWWQNVLQSDTQTFTNGNESMFGYSPYREVQLFIDEQLAGVHLPFPIIFTGGVAPGLWRPIVGIDAYDLREHEIDITPWLGILSDGAPHRYEIRVAGIQDDNGKNGTLTNFVDDNWLVTGKIFLWLDSGVSSNTTGSQPDIRISDPIISISSSLTQNAMGTNQTLTYSANVKRSISISSTIKTAKGSRYVSWTQDLTVKNYGYIEAQGATQTTRQTTSGTDESLGDIYYKNDYFYPLWSKTSMNTSKAKEIELDARISRGLSLTIEGTSIFPTGIEPFAQYLGIDKISGQRTISHLDTSQNGTAHYSSSKTAKTSVSYGDMSQVFYFLGSGNNASDYIKPNMQELYYRNVTAKNGTLISDEERIMV